MAGEGFSSDFLKVVLAVSLPIHEEGPVVLVEEMAQFVGKGEALPAPPCCVGVDDDNGSPSVHRRVAQRHSLDGARHILEYDGRTQALDEFSYIADRFLVGQF
ncbi:hypothetical protein GCM10009848_37590 [Micromonospora lupini]